MGAFFYNIVNFILIHTIEARDDIRDAARDERRK